MLEEVFIQRDLIVLGAYDKEVYTLQYLTQLWWKLMPKVTLEINHAFSIYLYSRKNWNKSSYVQNVQLCFSLLDKSSSHQRWECVLALPFSTSCSPQGKGRPVPVGPGDWHIPCCASLHLFRFGIGNTLWTANLGESQHWTANPRELPSVVLSSGCNKALWLGDRGEDKWLPLLGCSWACSALSKPWQKPGTEWALYAHYELRLW